MTNNNADNSQKKPLAFLEDYEAFKERITQDNEEAKQNLLDSIKQNHDRNMKPSIHAAQLMAKGYSQKIEERGLLSEELAEIKKENKKDFLFNLMDKKDSNAA